MIGMLAIVAGVVFFILVVRRLVAGDSDEGFGEVQDSSWLWDAELTSGGTDYHGSAQHHGAHHDSSGSGSSDGGWSWGSSDSGSSSDSSSSSDSGSSWF